jgi:hypothetical protein
MKDENKLDQKPKNRTTLTKTKTVEVATKKGGTYAYRYTELAEINDYIETIGETYYQYIDRIDNDDYIVTVRQKDGVDGVHMRGCRLVQATINNENSNLAQEQGSALTYARRYSLLMAYGLATEDDDAQSLNRAKEESKITTREEAEQYTLKFGKHKGKTLKEIFETDPSYIDWLMDSERTDEIIKTAIGLITGEVVTEEEQIMMIQEGQKQYIKGQLSPSSLESVLKKYNVVDINALTWEQANEIYKVIDEALKKKNKEKEEVF